MAMRTSCLAPAGSLVASTRERVAKMRRLRKRLGGRFGKKLGIGFENTDSPARAALSWSTEEILEALRSLGLPADSPLSVLTV